MTQQLGYKRNKEEILSIETSRTELHSDGRDASWMIRNGKKTQIAFKQENIEKHFST